MQRAKGKAFQADTAARTKAQGRKDTNQSEERKPVSGRGAKQARKRKVQGTSLICHEGETVINLSTEWICEEFLSNE